MTFKKQLQVVSLHDEALVPHLKGSLSYLNPHNRMLLSNGVIVTKKQIHSGSTVGSGDSCDVKVAVFSAERQAFGEAAIR